MTFPRPTQCTPEMIRRLFVPSGWVPRRGWLEDQRGAVMSEYVILVGVVGLVIVTALVGAGPELLAAYERSRGILMSPLP